MRFSVLPPSYSFVAIVMSRSRACFLSSITVILTTASEPSSFRVTVTFSMISRGDGSAAMAGATADASAPRVIEQMNVFRAGRIMQRT